MSQENQLFDVELVEKLNQDHQAAVYTDLMTSASLTENAKKNSLSYVNARGIIHRARRYFIQQAEFGG